jgi:LAS superfamily LD-carboxypeptidase LdcB
MQEAGNILLIKSAFRDKNFTVFLENTNSQQKSQMQITETNQLTGNSSNMGGYIYDLEDG